MRTCDFSKAKIGDKVFSSECGIGKIVDNNRNCIYYPLYVAFKETTRTYTTKGLYNTRNKTPELFWKPFEIPDIAFQKPLPDLKVDDKVLVWTNKCEKKYKRHFKEFTSKGDVICFDHGRTSWTSWTTDSTTCWSNYKIVKG